MQTEQSQPVVSQRSLDAEARLSQLVRDSPIPNDDLANNTALFMPPRTLKRVLFLDELYRLAMPIPGIIVQFGVRWGRDLAVFDSLRTIYEPFNISRKIVGFDTFEGFPGVGVQDGDDPMIIPGGLTTAPAYEAKLNRVMALRQELDPLPEFKRYEIVKGDAVEQFAQYLVRHPETIVSLAYFDMDIYGPTKGCLEMLKPFVTRGTVVAFDELNYFKAPGETLALKEVYALDAIRLRRSVRYSGQRSFFTIE